MNRIIAFCVLALIFTACSKNKFKTEPQVTIRSFGPSQVTKGDIFVLTAKITDKEGDLHDSVLLVRKRFNGTVLLTTDTLRYTLKDFGFPTENSIEIAALFSYGELKDGYLFQNLENIDHQLAIGVIVRDEAGHRSAYAESDKILLKKL